MKTPLIFDIKRCSTVDGPGIRTALFFKGCNLNCFWCHNPEGKDPEAQLALFSEKCISCGACKANCCSPTRCIKCSNCIDFCPTNARKLYGKKYSIPTLMDIILSDQPYYEATNGGVTFSGGECLLYPEFVAALAEECHKHGVSVAVDTAGNIPWEHLVAVLDHTDLFLYDIKCLDPLLHQRGTGCDNRLILENLDRLIAAQKKILIRIPVIPAFNEGEELAHITDFCNQKKLPYELLPYHSFGTAKQTAIESAHHL